jgi:hypothetical protein
LARQIEAEINKGSSITNLVLTERNLYQDVVGLYVQGVTVKTRRMREDTYRLRALARHIIVK